MGLCELRGVRPKLCLLGRENAFVSLPLHTYTGLLEEKDASFCGESPGSAQGWCL